MDIKKLWNNLKYRLWVFVAITVWFTGCQAPEIISSKSDFYWLGAVIPILLFAAVFYTYSQYSKQDNVNS